MSRSYTITVGDTTWSSQVNGAWNPNALDVMFDLQVAAYGTPAGSSFVRVWGLPLSTLLNAKQYNGQPITVTAGTVKGLPIANSQPAPAQLVSGQVFQAYANWVGTEQYLDLYILPSTDPVPGSPTPITLNWKKGQPLGPALESALVAAFPNLSGGVNVSISDKLVTTEDAPGQYASLDALSQYVYRTSKSIIPDASYFGVQIIAQGNALTVTDTDSVSESGPVQLAVTDLIGQPLWHGPNQIQIITVLRGDIPWYSLLNLPVTLATTTAAAQSQAQPSFVSCGPFRVNSVRHVGRFRSPQAEGWVTVFDCFSEALAAAA